MGLFGISVEEQKKIFEGAIGTVMQVHKEFSKENDIDYEDEELKEIFDNVLNVMGNIGAKPFAKQTKKAKISAEESALNVIQNVAMHFVVNGDAKSVICGIGIAAVGYDLYIYVNDRKYKSGFISKKQYEENAKLIEDIRLRSAF